MNAILMWLIKKKLKERKPKSKKQKIIIISSIIAIILVVVILVLYISNYNYIMQKAAVSAWNVLHDAELKEDELKVEDPSKCPCGDCTAKKEEDKSTETKYSTGSLGNSNEDIVFSFLASKGLDLMQIAAVMGNFSVESTGFNPKGENSAGYYGIAQWSPNGRKLNLIKFCNRKGLDYTKLESQLQFFWYEFNSGYKATYDMWDKSKSSGGDITRISITGDGSDKSIVRAMAFDFALRYEGCVISGSQHLQSEEERMKRAWETYEKFKGYVAGTEPEVAGDTGKGMESLEKILKFDNANIDTTNKEISFEQTITDCKSISVIDKTSSGVLSGGLFEQDKLNGVGIHYWGERAAASWKADSSSVQSTLMHSGAHFAIDGEGKIAQYLSISKESYATINAENGTKINIEVLHKDTENGQYSAKAYESLVHLVAYLSYECGFSLECNFKDDGQGNAYWDDSYIIRHFDARSHSGDALLRGKACPIYWTPRDGSGETGNNSLTCANGKLSKTEGGNARWIAFKIDTYNYIANYKDSENFKLSIVGLDDAKTLAKHTYDYSTATAVATSQASACSCGCAVPCPKCNCHGPYTGNTGVVAKLTGKMKDTDFGYGSFSGGTWASSTFLDAAKTVMKAMIDSGYDYAADASITHKPIDDLYSFRYDCSGYVSAVLHYSGYTDFNNNSSSDFETDFNAKYGWEKITDYKELEAGDILVMNKGSSHHVEIYAGNNKVYNCGSSASSPYGSYLTKYGKDVAPYTTYDIEGGDTGFLDRFTYGWRPTEPK